MCRQDDTPSVATDIEGVLQTTYGSLMLSQLNAERITTTTG
jgi:hypothetical protein